MKTLKKSILIAVCALTLTTPATLFACQVANALHPSIKSTHSGKLVPNEETVYVAKTGKKYHKSTCRYVSKSKTAMTKSEAKKKGYTACSICKP